jgi:hypothetical protein
MSQDMMVVLAKEVARDWRAQARFEAMSDAELAALGLDQREIAAIRDGFFDRVLMLGIAPDDGPPQAHGCCFG